MLKPQEQISTYVDNQGKASERKPGVQEPIKAAKPATSTTPGAQSTPAKPATAPATTAPPPQQ
jgi:hypothetical protein